MADWLWSTPALSVWEEDDPPTSTEVFDWPLDDDTELEPEPPEELPDNDDDDEALVSIGDKSESLEGDFLLFIWSWWPLAPIGADFALATDDDDDDDGDDEDPADECEGRWKPAVSVSNKAWAILSAAFIMPDEGCGLLGKYDCLIDSMSGA